MAGLHKAALCLTPKEIADHTLRTFNLPPKTGPITPFSQVDKYDIPKSIAQAMKSKYAYEWLEAILEEWLSHMRNGI